MTRGSVQQKNSTVSNAYTHSNLALASKYKRWKIYSSEIHWEKSLIKLKTDLKNKSLLTVNSLLQSTWLSWAPVGLEVAVGTVRKGQPLECEPHPCHLLSESSRKHLQALQVRHYVFIASSSETVAFHLCFSKWILISVSRSPGLWPALGSSSS